MSGIGRARIGELPPHQHHQAEAEEQEEEGGYRVLNADDFVILREDVFPPEPELLMRVIVRMPVRVAMRFRPSTPCPRRLPSLPETPDFRW